ncbi:MAG: ShlB/FhaC/HecB family hemolysin secretion/activation protein [Leptolyngbyaceae cyanobacterium bins.59]|nr:ShlB/FhaC/HecB family hemolysin secretion/activation protein [Leptolyngbyaceae cyanobacterium bins.59]
MRRSPVVNPPPPATSPVSNPGEGVNATLSSRPLSARGGVLHRLRAVGIVALAGVMGVGAVLLLRGFRTLNSGDTLGPIAEDTGGDDQPPLRNRLQIIRPGPEAISPPESASPAASSNQNRRSGSQSVASLRTNYGFGTGTQELSEEGEEAEEETGDAAAEEVTVAPPAGTAEPPAGQEAEATEPEVEDPIKEVRSVIASLLKPPQPFDSPDIAQTPSESPPTVATVTPRVGPAIEIPPRRPPASGLVRDRVSPDPQRPTPTTQPPERQTAVTSTTPTTPPTTPPQTTATPTTPTTATLPSQTATILPQTPEQGIFVERLPVVGSTQFSPQKLAETVRQALAVNGGASADTSSPTATDPTLLNRQVTPAELIRASEAITKLYTDGKFINSGAYVPAEVLQGAKPEIRVVEGRIEKIAVQVQPADSLWLAQPLSSGYVEQRLASTIQTPLNLDQLVDAVKILEQNPLISSVTTELAPGTTTGGSILNVRVKQAPPLRLNVLVNNSRTPSVGSLEQQLGFSHANLLGLGEVLQFNYRRTEGSADWFVGYAIPVTPSSTLSLGYTNGSGQVIEEPFRQLDIKSQSQNFEVAFRQSIAKTSAEELALTLRATHYYNRGIFLAGFNDGVALPFPAVGADANGETRVTAIRFAQEWNRRSEQDALSLRSEFSYGLNALGASVLPLAPDGRFLSWQGRGFWVRSFGPDTLLALRGQLQWADRQLLPVEQISLGGADTVRGYRPSTFLSDNGWFASIEGYLPVLRVPEWNGLVQVVPFFDIAQGWNNGDEQPRPNSLMSVGLGLQLRLGDNLRARLDWGIPLMNSSVGAGRSLEQNLFFSINYSP